MHPFLSFLCFPFATVVLAFLCCSALRRRSRKSRLTANQQMGLRLMLWAVSLALLRDHFLRSAQGPQSRLWFSMGLALNAVFALLFLSAVSVVERLKTRVLKIKRRDAFKDFFAGLGAGAALAYLLLWLQWLPTLPVSARVVNPGFLVLIGLWSLAQEMIFRGLYLQWACRVATENTAIMSSALLSTLSWLGLACFGPFPLFVVLSVGAWLSLTAALLRWRIGFLAGVGAQASMFFVLLATGVANAGAVSV